MYSSTISLYNGILFSCKYCSEWTSITVGTITPYRVINITLLGEILPNKHQLKPRSHVIIIYLCG